MPAPSWLASVEQMERVLASGQGTLYDHLVHPCEVNASKSILFEKKIAWQTDCTAPMSGDSSLPAYVWGIAFTGLMGRLKLGVSPAPGLARLSSSTRPLA